MNLAAAILEEHSRSRTDEIAGWVGRDRRRFAQLFRLVENGEPRLRQCAAWSVSRCVQQHPELIDPWLPSLLALLPDRRLHGALRRNFFQILQIAALPVSCHDAVFQAATEALGLPSEAPAVRAYAITVLKRLTDLYPELLPEVRRLVVEAASGSPPAVQSRARREFGVGRSAGGH